MMKNKIEEVLKRYDPKKDPHRRLGKPLRAGNCCQAPKQEGFETVVVCQNGREKTYARYYRNLFDHFIFLDKFSEITNPENVKKLTDLNTVFVPNRSFSVYAGYETIEEKFAVPLMGNRYMLRTEERNTPRNQLYLLQKAGIKTPKTFKSPEEIDRLAIVKVPEKERAIERAFFYASSPEEYEKTLERTHKTGHNHPRSAETSRHRRIRCRRKVQRQLLLVTPNRRNRPAWALTGECKPTSTASWTCPQQNSWS